MIDYLTHYYLRGASPFRSLSSLPDCEALRLMESLADDTNFGSRFKDPAWYLRARRETEQWVREQFILRGGRPVEPYPVYMVLGSSPWICAATRAETPAEIRVPLAAFQEGDVSFTYPDSMISLWFSRDKPAPYYLPAYHGKVFTRTEILSIAAEQGLPEETWETNLPPDLAPYIEAQVWNRTPLQAYFPAQTAG